MTIAAGLGRDDMLLALRAGLGDGSWMGTSGITSSVAATSGGSRTVGWLDNGDGSVTVAFAAARDTNLDGRIDLVDAANLIAGGRLNAGSPASWADGDFNYDGIVDIIDIADFVSSGMYDAAPYARNGQAIAVAIIPEAGDGDDAWPR
jgi:hypothetical protein